MPKHPLSTNLQRFTLVLGAIIENLPKENYVIKGFFGEDAVSKLRPQSYCTRLREAYKEALSVGIKFPCEVSFRWTPDSVIAYPTGQPKSLEPLTPNDHENGITIKAQPKDHTHIMHLCDLCFADVFEHPVEIQGEPPDWLPSWTEITRLPTSYLIQ